MKLPIYQVDAFADAVFAGNPAAIVPLDDWLPDALMQQIAAENNLAETAFFVLQDDGRYALRWFTPTTEVDLCGHATLASAWVLFHELGFAGQEIRFETRSGELAVTREDGKLWMRLPRHDPIPCEPPPIAAEALQVSVEQWLEGPNYLAVVGNAETVRTARPDMALLAQLPGRGLIVTAPGTDAQTDFVSRFFAPNFGIPEDPVTGSAHCMLTPYWAQRLSRNPLRAQQISARGGKLDCELLEDAVRVGGQAVLYLKGEVFV